MRPTPGLGAHSFEWLGAAQSELHYSWSALVPSPEHLGHGSSSTPSSAPPWAALPSCPVSTAFWKQLRGRPGSPSPVKPVSVIRSLVLVQPSPHGRTSPSSPPR